MKIKSIYFPIIIFSLLAIGVYIGKYINFPVDNQNFAKNNSRNKLNKLIDFINKDYVDDVNTDSIVDSTVDNILGKLDPHSVYISTKDQAVESQNMKGDFIGIGVNFYVINDTISIVNNMPGGPAEKAGLQAGDRILYADKSKLFGKKSTNRQFIFQIKRRRKLGSENYCL
jgi:carboxyl-terminal processing protease